jgi:ribonucleoside-diphosphate reductase alpha chain
MLKIEKITNKHEVYDITVSITNNFYANGILVHNCQEILLPTTPLMSLEDDQNLISLCTLLAINLGNIRNFDELESQCKNAVLALDNLLDYQDYMVPAAKTATALYRPLGIGVINLAYYLAKNGVDYQSPEGWKLIDETMEAINYYCIKASIELAAERGPCAGYKNTKWAQGLLPIDYYKPTIDEIVKFNPKQNWEWLREMLKIHGIRNATLTAFMPAESSAKISNATSGVDPIRALVTIKKNKTSITKQVVPEINRLKNKFDQLWEMQSMDGMIKSMAIINRLCSQSISTNLSYNPAHYPNGEIPQSVMIKDLLKANYYGLPTLYYHNTRDGREDAIVEDAPNTQPTNESVAENSQPEYNVEEDTCSSCTI